MPLAYLALGSNLGDRLGFLRAAVAELRADGGVLVCSPIYETDPVADTPQPPYFNAAVRVATTRPPEDLLRFCLTLERSQGRVRPVEGYKVARVLDIDLLLYDDQVLATPALTLPHPELLHRPFVRIPLAQVAMSGLRHPVTGDILDSCPDHPGVRLFSPPL